MRRILVGLIAVAVLAVGAVPAAASPAWKVHTYWADTHLQPGDTGLFRIQLRNVGATPSAGAVTVTNQLPPGVTRISPRGNDVQKGRNEMVSPEWTCAGSTTVTCTMTESVGTRALVQAGPGSGFAPRILFRVQVAPGAVVGTFQNTTTVSGGGAADGDAEARPLTISDNPLGFGVLPGNFSLDTFDAEWPAGEPVRQAGAHPFELRTFLETNLAKRENPSESPGLLSPLTWMEPNGYMKTIDVSLPTGFLGNPEATPKCSPGDFLNIGTVQYGSTGCPPETQIGVMEVDLFDGEERGGDNFLDGALTRLAVYNLEPPAGVPADFGFAVGPVQVHLYPVLDATRNYAIKTVLSEITTIAPVRSATMSLWGVPGDPAHDALRVREVADGEDGYGESFDSPIRPFLTLPLDCGESDLHTSGRFESWQEPDRFTPPVDTENFSLTGCGDPRFEFNPQISLSPTSTAAGGPTGLEVNLELPQRDDTVADATELYAENGQPTAIPTPPMKRVEVTFPEGLTVSTSAALGLGSCSLEQIKLGTNDPVSCPDSSQYGTLTVETPILPKGEPMRGQVFIAEQDRNPFDDFLALYLVIQEPQRGLLVKLPGRVQLDEKTGQIKTIFDNLPPFPVSNLQMALKGGARAALVNPATCGSKQITATFTPWHDQSQRIVRSNSYEITRKGDGSPCVANLGDRPFRPQVTAGTFSSAAAAYSPFVFRLTRTDDDQEIASLATKLPKGLLAKVAGISQCSEASIAASGGKTGKEELASPSCPQSSYLGTADVGSGVGQVLTFVQGKAYLAGPYKGAPLSMVVITPVVAGPYDLGTIAVRTALEVDPTTAQVEVATDPFPQIFKGIPVRIRDIRIAVDRPESTLNPTSCDPMAIEARIGGTGGDLFSAHDDVFASLQEHFQASNCAALGFKPGISFQLKGGTKRGQFPALTATLKARPGDANIRKARVTLPRTAFLAQEHIRTICTRVQFAAKACPEGSVIGHAKATSPLIDGSLEGPVVMRSSSNKLPDLVATLDGIIEVVVASRIDSFKRRIRSTFDLLPDVPVSSFELRMQGGKKGLIVNSADLCRVTSRGLVELTGHNGAEHSFKPKVKATSCKGKNRKAKKQHDKKKSTTGGATR